MTSTQPPPHPLLTEPVLYVADLPNRVKWPHLRQVFLCCDEQVRTSGRGIVPGTTTSRKRWTIHFTDLFKGT